MNDQRLFDTLTAGGGTATCRRLSEALYARIGRDPVLRPMFPGKTHRCAIEAFTAFLVQLLGGPPEDTQKRWWLSLRESHLRFNIGARERDAWMRNMIAALDDARIEEPYRGAFRQFFERSSAYVVNVGNIAAVAEEREDDGDGLLGLSRCWKAQRRLDETIAAIRGGDAQRAIALAETPELRAYLEQRRAVLAALLAVMIRTGHRALLDFARDRITQTPALVREHYHDRTLLHDAGIAANLPFVELLLTLGADVTAGVHPPLYSVANGCQTPGARDVVFALVNAGAAIDAHEPPKHCTALHMAARRGNVEIAAALLDCGANINARDSVGVTPLRRAINCRKPAVAALLRSKGAA